MSSNFLKNQELQVHDDIKFIPVRNTAAVASQKLENDDYQCGIFGSSFNSHSSLLKYVQVRHNNKKAREEPKIELKYCGNCGSKSEVGKMFLLILYS